MSTIYKDSALLVNKQYEVQDVTKFPTKKKFLIGKQALLVQITNTTASVRFTGQLHEIPVRSLFNIPGYIARSVRTKNADGFVIKCSNSFGIPIGTAYLEPVKVDDSYATFNIPSKGEIKLPLEILISLERKKVKVKDKVVKKEAKENGLPVTVIEAVTSAVTEEPIREIPSAVSKLLPTLNIPVLVDQIKSQIVEVFDFDGDIHSTIESAQLSNEKYIHRLVQDAILKEMHKTLSREFKDIRDKI